MSDCVGRTYGYNGLGKDISVSKKIRVVYISIYLLIVEDGLKYMFLMFEVMALMFVMLFCSVTNSKREIERLEQEQLELQSIQREIHELEDTLDFLEMMRRTAEDSEK